MNNKAFRKSNFCWYEQWNLRISNFFWYEQWSLRISSFFWWYEQWSILCINHFFWWYEKKSLRKSHVTLIHDFRREVNPCPGGGVGPMSLSSHHIPPWLGSWGYVDQSHYPHLNLAIIIFFVWSIYIIYIMGRQLNPKTKLLIFWM